ncbi:MAG TPA: VCBS repeat-containing protein, partial [Gemmatimonadaceae bacterium]|nr:VCBS repeat-containing protein [Gemmatimonadaceae bacterium]
MRFTNDLPEERFNILNYLYYYNGGGVAVGDVNNDGLPDLYFTSNLQQNRLYLNKGKYTFEDITDRSGVAGSPGWTTGATMADVNGDGWADIYVSAVDFLEEHGHNILYVNNRDGTFTDRTKEYGLEFSGYSTQAAFFDYDGDGDLDMYLLNHSVQTAMSIGRGPFRENRDPKAGDRLYRNDRGHFTDVSAQAGIYGGGEASGLGVVVSDVNFDGCPDIYVANDFQEDDFLYINNCKGTFSERLGSATGHTSRFSMGVDAADFNNDGRPDIIVADMLPYKEEVLKSSATTESFNIYDMKLRVGYRPQYARNTLQLNRGSGKFSEIGYLAGIAATDWSWAPLFADLDNDGRKDLFITNGIYRRPNDLDYINYVGNPAVQASLAQGATEQNAAVLKKMPHVPLVKFAFHNNGDLTFTDMASAWGLGQEGFSNGAAYVDLDNSGSLDLVVNNANAPASIYRNHSRDVNRRSSLTVTLRGEGANTAGLGAKVMIAAGGTHQLLEESPTRGFQSSVDPRLHFGLGDAARVDSLTVVWPDRRFQVLTNVLANRPLVLSQAQASGRYDYRSATPVQPLFADVTRRHAIPYKHAENDFYDSNREPLITHLLSTEGPALAVADVNGDGLDDMYAGGAKWQAGKLLLQQRDGSFRAASERVFAADSLSEDVDAAFFDANGDGRPDLYVASAGNEFGGRNEALRDRLYLNDGNGVFHRSADALPALFDNSSCVAPGDFDGDGDIDLFVGSRVVPQQYGLTPKSHLLENDGTGHFTEVTAQRADALETAGMVTSAAWMDYDGDGHLDLIVAGEWMPVRVFHQEGGHFVDRTAAAGLTGSEGWWSSVTVADLNGDSRPDLVLGNLGLNSYITASAKEPARLYVDDFANDGSLEQILTFYKHGVSYPLPGRDDIVRLLPALRSRYPTYADFGASRIEDILPAASLARATVRQATDFASSVAINEGNGRFSLHALPAEAQFAPVRTALARDFDGDGKADLLVAGNFFAVTPAIGRYDASYGQLLHGLGDGRFTAVDMTTSGLLLEGQVRHLAELRSAKGQTLIVAARNDTT